MEHCTICGCPIDIEISFNTVCYEVTGAPTCGACFNARSNGTINPIEQYEDWFERVQNDGPYNYYYED